MKFLVQFSRVIIGLLFILSGMLKLNDPAGFSYKLEEYFGVFAQDIQVEQDSVVVTLDVNGLKSRFTSQPRPEDSTISIVVVPGEWKNNKDTDSNSLPRVSIPLRIMLNGMQLFSDTFQLTNDSLFNLSLIASIGSNQVIQEEFVLSEVNAKTNSFERDVSAYVKDESWLMTVFQFGSKHALFISIFFSWMEAILGFALLIGWQARFTTSILFLLTAFFAFLTWYSWIYNKVTDCGCFGDALPMGPKESFIKNLVIGIFIVFLYFGRKNIKPVFSNPFGVKVLTILTMLLVGFSLYCEHYLPVVDFLHFKEGNDIRALMKTPNDERTEPYIVAKYRYKSTDGSGQSREVIYDSDARTFTPKLDALKWEFDTILEEKVIEESYTPPIRDFMFLDTDNDKNYIDSFWKDEIKLLLVFPDLKHADKKAVKELREISAYMVDKGYKSWALTSSTSQEVEQFRHDHQISEFNFHYGDYTQLKSIIRSNPGLLLITDSTIVKRQWPSTRLPTLKKLDKLTK